MKLSNLKIGARLGLGFALTIAVMLAMTLTGISRIQFTAGLTDRLVNDRAVKVQMVNEMRSYSNRAAQALRNAALAPDEATAADFLRQLGEADRTGAETARKLGATPGSRRNQTPVRGTAGRLPGLPGQARPGHPPAAKRRQGRRRAAAVPRGGACADGLLRHAGCHAGHPE